VGINFRYPPQADVKSGCPFLASSFAPLKARNKGKQKKKILYTKIGIRLINLKLTNDRRDKP
jgi:hypothetical protein